MCSRGSPPKSARAIPTTSPARRSPSAPASSLVADAFEAITADRPYRPAQTQEAALAELRACAGSQFDPAVIEALELHLGTTHATLEALA